MKFSSKNFGLALLILSLSAPVLVRAEGAADPQQQGNGQQPARPAPQPEQPRHGDNHDDHRPAPPVHRGPPPGEYHEHHHDDNTARNVAVGLGAAELGFQIFNAIKNHNENKVVGQAWALGNDDNFHCYNVNKKNEVVDGNAVNESICAYQSDKPVRYEYEQYTDGKTYCYSISTLDNTYLNDNYPVDNSFCEAAAQQNNAPADPQDDGQDDGQN